MADITLDIATNSIALDVTQPTVSLEVGLPSPTNIVRTTDTDVSGNSWVLDEDDFASDSATKVPTQQSAKAYADTKALASHNHAASDITSGTLAHERGGLEADVSAYSGLVKISGGATSQAVADTDYQSVLAEGPFADGDKTKLDGIETSADVTDAVNVGSSIHGATAKTSPVDADTLPLIDSAASNVLKKVTWANIKATLKTYFDTLYNFLFYEEGTFTPAISFGGGTTGITYSVQSGSYTKIGRFVSFKIFIILTSKGTDTGGVLLTGFPFTISIAGTGSPIFYTNMSGLAGVMGLDHQEATTTIKITELTSSTASQLDDTHFTNSSFLILAGSYHAS